MGQEVHVTSAAIERLQHQLKSSTIPFLEEVVRAIDDSTRISPLFSIFPPFSVIGLWVEKNYDDQRRFARDVLAGDNGALHAIDALVAGLETVKRNWRSAEDASTVKYQ